MHVTSINVKSKQKLKIEVMRQPTRYAIVKSKWLEKEYRNRFGGSHSPLSAVGWYRLNKIKQQNRHTKQ